MTVLRYSPTGASLAFVTLLLGSALLLASLAPSFAAPTASSKAAAAKPVKEKVAAVGASEADGPSATGSIRAAEEGGAGCQRARRKLWVDGEGWIVRRVTVC